MNVKTIIVTLLTLNLSAFPQNNDQQLAESMLKVISQNQQDLHGNTQFEGLPSGMEAISEDERIRMIASYIYNRPGDRGYVDTTIKGFLNRFPDVLTTRSEIEVRRMMREEKDPRRFYLLHINLVSPLLKRFNQVFIAEMAPMLLRNDPVARGHLNSEYHDERFDDVSISTYSSIVWQLKQVNASFQEPSSDLPHAHRKLILAHWLKENWPGCENLDLPDRESLKKPARTGRTTAAAATSQRTAADRESVENAEGNPLDRWVWIGGGVLLTAATAVWLRAKAS